MLKWAFYILSFLCSALSTQAQNEYSNWYFGAFSGTTFNSAPPTILEDGQILTDEGTAVISDVNGNLLFYTDSRCAWDRYHDSINPDTLMISGSWSSVNGAFVVQKPGSATLYYIFSTDEHRHAPPLRYYEGIYYSILDIEGNGGLGEIITYNQPFLLPATEKFTAVKHLNGKDVWCLAPLWDPYEQTYQNDIIYCRLLTENGLGPPMYINTGTPFLGDETQDKVGCLKASPNGRYLALGESVQGKVHVYEFDNATASVTHIETLTLPYQYGLEFSPDSRFLYVSRNGPPGFVYQYDLLSTPLVNNHVEIDAGGFSTGGLQLAPDKKIYLSVNNDSILGVVNEPNELGLLCDFSRQGPVISLEPFDMPTGAESRSGLPAGISSEIIAPNFNYGYHCFGDTAFFTLLETEYDSVYWDFGDPLSGSDNYSTEENPWHIYVEPNYHRVGLTLYNGEDSVTGFHWVRATWPTLGLEDDTLVCENEVLSLQMLENGATYQWQDSTVSSSYEITEAGTYWVTADLKGCIDSDTIQVTEIPLHTFSIGSDTTVCIGDTVTLFPYDTLGQTNWSTGETALSIAVSEPGFYWLDMASSSTGCIARDSVQVLQPMPPTIDPIPEDSICITEYPFEFTAIPIEGLWSGMGITDSIDGRFEPAQAGAGLHWIRYTVSGSFCVLVDSIQLEVISNVAGITTSGNLLTAIPSNGTDYQWFLNGEPVQGATDIELIATESGNYTVEMTDSLGCRLRSGNLEFTLQIGIEEYGLSDLNFYPNPVSETLYIDGVDAGQEYLLTVFDATGRLLYSFICQDFPLALDCSFYPNGSYFISMVHLESGKFSRQMIIIAPLE